MSRVAPDMGSETLKKDKETPKQVKPEVKSVDKAEEQTKPLNKRHATRSTPNNTPAKKRK